MSRLLEGRVAIVTGAGRGIGRAHALELARQGARVVVNDFGVSLAGEKTDSPAHDVVAEIEALGGEAVVNGADVADFEQAGAMVQQAIDTFGGLDILVNNAGFVRDRMLVNTSEEEWDAVIRVHLKGHFAPLRHAGAYWRTESKEGRTRAARVINTSSGAGVKGFAGQAAYSAAKHGVIGLTKAAALDYAKSNIRVNAVCPGPVDTRMIHAIEEQLAPGNAAAVGERYQAAIPSGRYTTVEEIASMVLFLCSDLASNTTGGQFVVDGGRTATGGSVNQSGWR